MRKEYIRVMAVLMVILVLFTFFIWYGSMSPAPTEGRYPGGEELIGNYEVQLGKKVEVSEKVVETEPLVIEVKHGEKNKEIQITGVKKDIELKDRISVFGEVKEDNTIDAEKVVVYPYWNYIYMYLISIVGVSWLGIRFFSQWTFDRDNYRFKAREEPLSIKQVLSQSLGGGDDG